MRKERAATEIAPEPPAEPARPGEARPERAEPAELGQALLRPRAVALIGAGNDPDQPAGRALHLLRRHSFRGALYPVDAGRRLVQGTHAWPDLAALPGPVDLALILHEGEAAIDAVDACGRARVPVAVVQSALDGDGCAAGRARLLATARRHGVRIVGPGSGGAVVPASGLALTGEPAFAARPLRPGRLMLLSQDGGAMGALFSRAAARDLGFAALVAFGDELDVSLGEVGDAAVDDPEIDAFLLFIHELRHAASLARFAAKAHATGKPIIAYKRRAPAVPPGHGAAADAFLRAHGILRVDQFDTLLELAPMMVRRRPARGRAAALVATGRGAGTMVADRLALADVALAGLDDLARQRLARKGVALAPGPVAEIADAARPEAVQAVLDEALDAPNNDVVLAILGAGAEIDPAAAVAPVVAAAQRADKPLAALIGPESPEALRLLSGAGVAAFRTPEAAADGLGAFLQWRAPSAPALLWEDGEAIPGSRRTLHAGQAMQIFRPLGISIPTMLWVRRDAPVPKTLPFPPPYVVKVLAPDIEHRLELGGVALGIETVTAVQLAADTVVRRVRAARPAALLDGVAIQRMERGLLEVAIGFRRDPEAGPVVTLAMGEGLADIYGDRAVRLAPIDRATAYAMIDEVRGLAPIRGHRNRPRGDLEALAHALVAMSSFALIAAPRVLTASIDPLLVKAEGQGAVALDGAMQTE